MDRYDREAAARLALGTVHVALYVALYIALYVTPYVGYIQTIRRLLASYT